MHKQTKQWMSALLAALMFSSSAFSVDFSAHANEKNVDSSATQQEEHVKEETSQKQDLEKGANPSGKNDASISSQTLSYGDIRLETRVEGEQFIIFSTTPNAKEYFEQLQQIVVNGVSFDKEDVGIVISGNTIVFLNNPTKEDENQIRLVWKDGEQNVTFMNKDDKAKLPSYQALSLSNGEYKLPFEAKNKGALNLGGLLDANMKLTVKDGAYTISFLVYQSAAAIEEVALKGGSAFNVLSPTVLETDAQGEKTKIEYQGSIDSLKDPIVIAVFGEKAPFNGTPSDKGQFDKYHQVELQLDEGKVTAWNGYENMKNSGGLAGDPKLIEGLIGLGFDTNNDKKISEEELRNSTIEKIELDFKEIQNIDILTNLGPNIKLISLTGNNISSLKEHHFENATGLIELRLGGNQITEIPNNLLSDLKKLEGINLSENPIKNIPTDIFAGNPNLKMVVLENMGLTQLPADLLKNNPEMESLIITGNEFELLPDDLFENNKKMLTFFAGGNRLKKLPESISGLEELAVLLAGSNQITSIPESFGNLKEMKFLNLGNNRLTSIPKQLLFNMITQGLVEDNVHIILSQNNIKELPFDEMIEVLEAHGGKPYNLMINKNLFPEKPDAELMAKMERLGVHFSGGETLYYPQKTSMDIQLVATDKKIKISKKLSHLEMFYWELINHPVFGRGSTMDNSDDLIKLIDIKERERLGLGKNVPRDEVVQALYKKDFDYVGWKIETFIEDEKGNPIGQSYVLRSKNDDIDKLIKEVEIPNMVTGNKYRVIERFYIGFDEDAPMWMENINEVVATDVAPPPKVDGRELKEHAHILDLSEEKYSDINDSLKSLFVKANKTSSKFKMESVNFQFDKLQKNGKDVVVSALSIKVKDRFIASRAVAGKKGEFLVFIPSDAIQKEGYAKDSKWTLKITMKDDTNTEVVTEEVILLLDWNKDFALDSKSKGKLLLSNKDKSTNAVLTGSKFKISGPSYNEEVVLQNADGLELELKEGEYTVTQILAPRGYKLDSTSKKVTIKADEKVKIEFFNEKESSGGSGSGGSGSGGSGSGGGGGYSGGGSTTIKDNKVPLANDPKLKDKLIKKAEKIIAQKGSGNYREETIAAVEKALQDFVKGMKDSEANLIKALDVAHLEKVSILLSKGFMSGFPGNKFMPNKNMTRAEVAAMFTDLLDEEPETIKTFSDIKAQAWYADSLAKIASLGYLKADENGRIHPQKNITRAEYAYIISKVAKLKAGTKSPADVNQTHWAAEAIAANLQAGVIAGYKDGTFKPENEITRAEAVSMLSRAFNIASKNNRKKDYDDVKPTHWAYDVIMSSSK